MNRIQSNVIFLLCLAVVGILTLIAMKWSTVQGLKSQVDAMKKARQEDAEELSRVLSIFLLRELELRNIKTEDQAKKLLEENRETVPFRHFTSNGKYLLYSKFPIIRGSVYGVEIINGKPQLTTYYRSVSY